MLDELNNVAQYLGYISLVGYVAGVLWVVSWFVRGIVVVLNRIRYDRRRRLESAAEFDRLRRTWIDEDKSARGARSANEHPTDVFVLPMPGLMEHEARIDPGMVPTPRSEPYDYQEDLRHEAARTDQGR